MKNIPKIEIKADKEKDKELFNNFLNHPNFPQHRHMILKAFPELKTLLTEKEEEDVVEEFVNNFYKDHRETITNIIKKSREEIKKYGKDALELLAKTMDYGWEKPITYKAKPTILPFSPYEKNVFYFSILPDIKNKKTKSVIEIALHEISHFIFLEQLENLEINTKKEVIHYIKEALTTAILNQQKFRKFNIPKREGNPEIKYIQVEYKGTIYKLVNFVEEIIKEKGYHEGIKYIILLVNKASEKFFNKTSLWNKYGKNITEIHSIFKDYLKPVKINKG